MKRERIFLMWIWDFIHLLYRRFVACVFVAGVCLNISVAVAQVDDHVVIQSLLADGFEVENLRVNIGPNGFSPDGNRIVFAYQKYNDKMADKGIFKTRDERKAGRTYYTDIHNPPKYLEYNGVAIYDLVQDKIVYNYRLPNAFYIQKPAFNRTGTHVAFVVDYGFFTTGKLNYGFSFFWQKDKRKPIWYMERLLPSQDLFVLDIAEAEMQKYIISKKDEMPYVLYAVPSPSGQKIAFMPYIHDISRKFLGLLNTMVWELHLSDNTLIPIVPRRLISTLYSGEQNHFLYMDEYTIRALVYYKKEDKQYYICDFDTRHNMRQNVEKCMFSEPIPILSKYTDEEYFEDSYAQLSFDGTYVVSKSIWDVRERPSYNHLKQLNATAMMIKVEYLKKYDIDRVPADKIIPLCIDTCEQDMYGNKNRWVFGEAIYKDKLVGIVSTGMYDMDEEEREQYDVYKNHILGIQTNDTNEIRYLPLGYSRNWVQTPYTIKDIKIISLPEIGYKWGVPYKWQLLSHESYTSDTKDFNRQDLYNLDPYTLEYMKLTN